MNGQRKVDIIGELNLLINVFEQVILAEPEYAKISHLLIRIYKANNRLFLRFSQLAAIEISGDLSTASILFRANTLLTKMPEAYMRIVGRSFLESSVGPVIRRICMTKKDKTIKENGKELKKVTNEIWQSIYINRSRCPTPLRKIFAKIQGLVGDAYVDQDMRLTSISAFVFLRFFVRAILTARLFNVIQFQPDSKSQRTLTLIAKTLQGLGNLTLFGIKEPWMSMMNEFISTQLDLFRDYVSYIASESDSTKPEWMSKEYEGLIAITKRKSSAAASSSSSSKHHSSVLPPKTTTKLSKQPGVRSRRYTQTGKPMEKVFEPSRPSSTTEFLKVCGDLHAKSKRRYLKIIQSESKDPSSSANNVNKVSSSSAASNITTTTTTAATRTTTASSSSSAHDRDSSSTY
ncbi:hypothetical protein PCASD_15597 [Puccinia coronata f. sp. avenae]|uniref:Ras-GAP domain-containing protein n=1 Tax=Puccinia coronata f. sp. avenae TaxID=200324 RepID=A0A2N5TY95_9BASI|nr:hypothetical protein PCASD_15597 [Puccinia coronata f. sp. avenae]